MYLPQAWQQFFGNWVSMPVLQACMPFLEREGFDGMLALTLSVLDLAQRDILQQSDLEQLVGCHGLLSNLHSLAATAKPPGRVLRRYWLHRIRRARLTRRVCQCSGTSSSGTTGIRNARLSLSTHASGET